MILACPHIRENIRRKKRLPKTIRLAFVDKQEADKRFRYHIGLDYCSSCATERRLPQQDQEERDDRLSSFYDPEFFQPACFDCFTEFTGIAS
jgi:hypothetical protein